MQPITYYIDRTVPVEWRPYVRAGILEWNRAFEEAGFRDAIRVLDAPDDSAWSAADARYSTVRWTATNGAVYAIGPTNVDPRTGEILNADILISAAWVQRWSGQSDRYVAPVAAVQCGAAGRLARASRRRRDARLCRYGEELGQSGGARRARSWPREARSPRAASRPARTSARRSRRWSCTRSGTRSACATTSAAPPARPPAQLANKGWTSTHGVGVSVMDYSPPALAADPARQGDYYAPTIGSYDRWAIAYGYADVTNGAGHALDAPRARARTPPRGRPRSRSTGSAPSPRRRPTRPTSTAPTRTRASAASGSIPTVAATIRPTTRSGWARGRVALIDGLFDSLETRVVAPGQSYGRLRTAFTDLLNDRWYALLVTTKYLGGATTSRDHRGDPGARPAVVNVPAAQQRAALTFLADAGFGEARLPLPARAAESPRLGSLDALGHLAGIGRSPRLPAP